MQKHMPEDRAENLVLAIEGVIEKARQRGVKMVETAGEVVAIIKKYGATQEERYKLYTQFMQKVRSDLGFQAPGRKHTKH